MCGLLRKYGDPLAVHTVDIVRMHYKLVLLLLVISLPNLLADADKGVKPIGKYTPSQQKALEKFRNIMGPALHKDYMKTDQYLIRWLQIQDFNIERAKAQLERTLKWRHDNGVDGILKEDFRESQRLCPIDASATDRAGRPVVTILVGSCNLRRLSLTGEFDKVKRVIYHMAETSVSRIHESQLKGLNVSDLILLVNSVGFNLREHACLTCLPGFTELFTVYETYYPLYFYKVIIINMPRIANVVLTFIQPLLSEHTRSVFSVYGFDKEEWQPQLWKLIPPNELDITFGGTKKAAGYANNTQHS